MAKDADVFIKNCVLFIFARTRSSDRGRTPAGNKLCRVKPGCIVMGPGQKFFTQAGSGQFFAAPVGSAILVQVWR